MPKLTKRHIDALPAREKEYFVWDDQLKGFGVRVYPNGGKRYVAQAFRRGKTIRVQIGRYEALAFEQAKARARQAVADIDDGRNPDNEKETERLSPTIAQLAERFLEQYVPHHCKPRTQVEYRHAVNRYILPALGSIKLTALARDDVAALHHEMRDKPYQANRTLGVVSKLMNQAEAWGLRPDRSNPCYHIRKYKERKRERFLTGEELARLGKALDEEESLAPAAVRMIAGGRRDDPARALLGGERRELVVGASELEREYRLKVLALEPHFAAEPGGELRSQLQRRLAGHVVDACLQDLGDVVSGHGSGNRAQIVRRPVIIAADSSAGIRNPANAGRRTTGTTR